MNAPAFGLLGIHAIVIAQEAQNLDCPVVGNYFPIIIIRTEFSHSRDLTLSMHGGTQVVHAII